MYVSGYVCGWRLMENWKFDVYGSGRERESRKGVVPPFQFGLPRNGPDKKDAHEKRVLMPFKKKGILYRIVYVKKYSKYLSKIIMNSMGF